MTSELHSVKQGKNPAYSLGRPPEYGADSGNTGRERVGSGHRTAVEACPGPGAKEDEAWQELLVVREAVQLILQEQHLLLQLLRRQLWGLRVWREGLHACVVDVCAECAAGPSREHALHRPRIRHLRTPR